MFTLRRDMCSDQAVRGDTVSIALLPDSLAAVRARGYPGALVGTLAVDTLMSVGPAEPVRDPVFEVTELRLDGVSYVPEARLRAIGAPERLHARMRLVPTPICYVTAEPVLVVLPRPLTLHRAP